MNDNSTHADKMRHPRAVLDRSGKAGHRSLTGCPLGPARNAASGRAANVRRCEAIARKRAMGKLKHAPPVPESGCFGGACFSLPIFSRLLKERPRPAEAVGTPPGPWGCLTVSGVSGPRREICRSAARVVMAPRTGPEPHAGDASCPGMWSC